MLYPLKFQPIYKDKIWGGKRLKSLFNKDFSPLPNCGESWELSGVPSNLSVVKNGFLAGNNIKELSEIYMGDLLGDKVFEKYGDDFPLLVKLLDTESYLSIQVHPGDEYALKHHNSLGKTEMWVVLQASDDSEIITGFNREVTPDMYLQHLKNNTLREILNIEKPLNGDVFFIPAGRIHAIGSNITLLEIQQSSDVTYRVFDWNRKDTDGKERSLHTDKALEVMDFTKHDTYKTRYIPQMNEPVELVKNKYFTTRLLELNQPKEIDYMFIDSFVIFTCIEGTCKIQYPDNEEWMQAGDLILLPADLKNIVLNPANHCKLVESYITE